jgi:hypothetical protein
MSQTGRITKPVSGNQDIHENGHDLNLRQNII